MKAIIIISLLFLCSFGYAEVTGENEWMEGGVDVDAGEN